MKLRVALILYRCIHRINPMTTIKGLSYAAFQLNFNRRVSDELIHGKAQKLGAAICQLVSRVMHLYITKKTKEAYSSQICADRSSVKTRVRIFSRKSITDQAEHRLLSCTRIFCRNPKRVRLSSSAKSPSPATFPLC